MGTRLPLYRMSDGKTRLGEEYFNKIWADLDTRLDTLEKLRISWQQAVGDLQSFGLDRIDNSLVPVLGQAQSLLNEIQEQSVELPQNILDNQITPLLANAVAVLDQAQEDADTLAAMLEDADWDQDLADLSAAINASLTALSLDLSNLATGLSTVATSGNYNDLSDKPTLPEGDIVGTNGAQTLAQKTLVDPVFTGTPTEDAYSITDTAGFAIDPANGSIQLITLGASRTPTAANFTNNKSVTLGITDGADFAITWTIVNVWQTPGGVAPTLKTTGITWIELWKVGGVMYAAKVGT